MCNYNCNVTEAQSNAKMLCECYYHATFGQRAKRCRPPSSFQDQGNTRARCPFVRGTLSGPNCMGRMPVWSPPATTSARTRRNGVLPHVINVSAWDTVIRESTFYARPGRPHRPRACSRGCWRNYLFFWIHISQLQRCSLFNIYFNYIYYI